MKKLLLLLSVVTMVVVLAACSGGDDKKITVGAKNFTEQFLFAKMSTYLLEAEGFDVEERTNLGSSALRQALENEQVDLTWDYTGTGLVVYLGEDPIADGEESFEAVKEIDAENGITWTNYTSANNTYTLMMRADHAEELGIQSISDLAAYVNENPEELSMATDAEFANRDDGLPGVYETYGFEFPDNNVNEMEIGLNYDALRDEQVDVSVGFATDARIAAFDFVNLEDDQSFFPSYNAAVAMTTEAYENYPEIEEIFEPLEDIFDDETLQQLNYEVDIEERSVDDVAREFLVENGLIEE